MLDRLAALVDRRPVLILLVTLVVAGVCGAIGASVISRLDPLGFDDPASESVRGDARLDSAGWLSPDLVVLVDTNRSPLATVTGEIDEEPLVARVVPVPRADAGSVYLQVAFRPSTDKELQDAAQRIESRIEDRDGVAVGGEAASFAQLNRTIQDDLIRAELYAFPILFLLALLLFRSVVAASLPLLVGALAVVGTMFALRVLAELFGISLLALNVVTALGFGLAIDYSLFMVSRYREELARSGPGPEAMRVVLATAGRTVFFSALTVAAAVASLAAFPQQFLYSIAIGGATVAALAAVVALVVLPAALRLLGPRVDALAPRFLRRRASADARPVTAGVWYRTAMFVMRRPLAVALVSGALLLVAALPALGLRFTAVDSSVLPAETGSRQVYDVLQRDGALARSTPISIWAPDPGSAEVVARAAGELPERPVAGPVERLPDGSAVVQVVADSPVFSESRQDLVESLRAVAGDGLVTGPTADFVDLQASMLDHLPLVGLIIVLSTMVVIFLMTGSVVLGIKTLLMNALTLAAVFGVLVAVFQDGRFESFLDYRGQGALESTIPLILFAGVFGLSTDYGVFLLARIKEIRDGGVPDRRAVALGQAQTGRLITSAALLFCVAVGAFGTTSIVGIKEMTLGIALGVLLDATIVRILLVPALMQMLSRWNWWSPRPLARLHARLRTVDAQVTPAEPGPAGAAPGR